MSDRKLLEIAHFTKKYGPATVLRDVSVTVGSGEFVGLLGPNGAGKSTLIKILAGVVRRDFGDLKFDGRPRAHLAGLPRAGFVHATADIANNFLIPAFAAAFLSTVVLSAGRFHVWGAVVGGVVLVWIRQGLVAGGVPFSWSDVVNGVILAAAVAVSTVLHRRARR
ncbi:MULTISPECIES: ATP-binding cassette domain-containing protein [unclassified Pseudofrankia]|uniref:ATP-binding cassette domain-containing protein n=1 Tax=unclassified Pseudofrankia TaxID=2994372 RepID=UPI0008D9D681|nr:MULTISPECIES: ATP-binding cassette domain-containing protein [unclassified Pseudofrankia]MDT3444707.1 ATP-binding cassette domain-containing protein [Pseudofrankia sp. BMG5.37]OHV66557.1 hypothetical protein BCD48_35730 [Pseudofrankia sp. BMG5.36]